MLASLRRTAALLTLAALVCAAPFAPAFAQDQAERDAFAAERSIIESALGTVVQVLERAVLGDDAGPLGASLRDVATDLTNAAQPFDRHAAATDVTLSRAEVQRLAALLRSLDYQAAALVERADSDEATGLADLQRTLADALALVEAVERRMPDAEAAYTTMAPADVAPSWDSDDDGWRSPARDERTSDDGWDLDGPALPNATSEPITWTYDYDPDRVTRGDNDGGWMGRRSASRARAPFDTNDEWEKAYVGAAQDRNPFRQDAIYRDAPAVRYNRVEGVVLGVALPRLDWYDADRAALYGQVGYAFALEDIRYTVGLEARPGRAPWRSQRAFDFKIGGAYRQNTGTEDLWKSSWFENSTAAFLFEHDFFDYYEVEGWTVYGVARASEFIQASVGYRDEIYRDLDATASFSVFDGDAFRRNPAVLPPGEDQERLRSVVATWEAGRIADWYDIPVGGILRAEAEFGDGLGGDTDFNRFIADARVYLPVGYHTGIALRMRGGYATDDAPRQKQFTIGGVGTSRGFPQHIRVGTRAVVANAEVTFDDVELSFFDDIQLFGFTDLAWTNANGSAFDLGDALPTAGLGLGLAERYVRLELAFPLRDVGYGTNPTLWFRLLPTF